MHISCITENAIPPGPREPVQSLQPEGEAGGKAEHLLSRGVCRLCDFRAAWSTGEMVAGYGLSGGDVGGLDRSGRTGDTASTDLPAFLECEAWLGFAGANRCRWFTAVHRTVTFPTNARYEVPVRRAKRAENARNSRGIPFWSDLCPPDCAFVVGCGSHFPNLGA